MDNFSEEDTNVLRIRLGRISGVLEEIQPIIKEFMDSKNGAESGGRENLMTFAILERIYYNAMGSLPLARELVYNHNIAVPLSQIFRAIIYEIIIGYWLLDSDFYKKAAMLNGEFIKKNSARLKKQSHDENDMQRVFSGWVNIAPENFDLIRHPNGGGELQVKSGIAQAYFSSICDSLINRNGDISSLSLSYAILSQQAHLSEFSREIIYNRYEGNIKLFDSTCHSAINSSLFLAKKIDSSSRTADALMQLLEKYYPKG